MKKIIVTGASGFIGSNLIPYLLKKKIKILSISKRNINLKNIICVKCNISSIDKKKEIINKFNADTIVHLAWHGIPNLNEQNSRKSLKESKNFFKKILKISKVKRIISLGSCLEYLIHSGEKKESDSLNVKNPFSRSKNDLRIFLEKTCKANKISLAWLRVFYIYGKNQRRKSIINFIIKHLKLRKKKIKFKNPFLHNDYIFINDFNKLIYKIINKNKFFGTFNVGYSKGYSPIKIFNIIKKLLKNKYCNVGEPIKITTKTNSFISNIKKTKNIFNWNPEYSMSKGIKAILIKK